MLCAALAAPAVARAQDRGAAALANALGTLRHDLPRVLYIAAHPDDEDTRLIAWLSRGGYAEAAYLSLTRGEGGQNLIGNELGDALGVLRTQELLAARRSDGAIQYFTRAWDFGYSKNAEETYSHWPRDSLLRDVVRIVRAFRPHILVATFSGTPLDGHGQHQVSGLLTREAYELADDTTRFPTREFGAPWRPLKLYRRATFSPEAATIAIDVGEYDPLRGRSYVEIAGSSRSSHRSQGFRASVRLGEVLQQFRREATRVNQDTPAEAERSIFDGIPGAVMPRVLAGDGPAAIRAEMELLRPETAFPLIARFSPRDEFERARYDRAAVLASGVAYEALAARPFVAAEDTISVTHTLHNRGTEPVRVDSAGGAFPRRWVEPGTSLSWMGVLRRTELTQPWWLARPRRGDLYDVRITHVSENERDQRGGHWARANIAIRGLPIAARIAAPVTHRLEEPPYGDLNTLLVVAPALTVTPAREREYLRAGVAEDRALNVTVQSNLPGEREVVVRAIASPGLALEPGEQRVVLEGGGSRTLTFRLRGALPAGEHLFAFEAETGGQRFSFAVQRVEYDHINPQRLYRRAEVRITAVDVSVPPDLEVAYLTGMADEGAQVLEELGVEVRRITVTEIPRLDLSQFSTIVVGPRAYEANPELQQHNQRLFDYVRGGGRLVVQFGQYPMERPGVLLYPITTRPVTRVTDENAPVTLTHPDAPELNYPNAIAASDFVGWVQERATFMPATFDSRYRTVLAMNDAGETPKHSAVLVATLGNGTYVYTTLALFRQFTVRVPGAARIFLNLLAPSK